MPKKLLSTSRILTTSILVYYDSREVVYIVPEINHLWVRASALVEAPVNYVINAKSPVKRIELRTI